MRTYWFYGPYQLLVILLGITLGQIGAVNLTYAGVNRWTTNGPAEGEIHGIAIDPTTPTTLYAGTFNAGVFKSTDGGITWEATNTGLTDLKVQTLVIDPSSPMTVYVGTQSAGVFRSTSGGGNWTASNTGLTNLNVLDLQINPSTPLILYAGTLGGGVFRSLDGGMNWSPVNTGLTGLNIFSLAIDPISTNTLYAAALSAGVFRSTNGGANWSLVNTGLTTTTAQRLAIDPINTMTVYVGTREGGAFRTLNGGANWTAINTGLTNLDVEDFAIDLTDPLTIYAVTDSGGIFKSTNRGTNWKPMNAGLTNLKLFFVALDSSSSPMNLYGGTVGSGVFDWQIAEAFIGTFRPSTQRWFLDLNGNGQWDGCSVDGCRGPFGLSNDRPVAGDWDGIGIFSYGTFRPSTQQWFLDLNGNGQWNGCSVDGCLGPFGLSTDIPVVGDWDNTGTTRIGVFRPSTQQWFFDLNGNGQWNGVPTDGRVGPFGLSTDRPIVGDWTGSGTDKIGVFRPSTRQWLLDLNGNGQWNGCSVDACLGPFGLSTDIPLAGDWDSTGTARIGAFRPSTQQWFLDLNGNGQWDGCSVDGCRGPFGLSSDGPVVGAW
jgi:photosystem II stability/assembly factor-like uncharacterized protein